MERARARGWLVPALLLGIFAAGLYGLAEHQGRSASLANLDALYQGAFHGAVAQWDEAQGSLTRALLVTDGRYTARELSHAAEHAAMAQTDLTRWPKSLFDGTVAGFLGYVAAFADRLAGTVSERGSMTQSERMQLQSLQAGARQITADLRGLQDVVTGRKGVFVDRTIEPAGAVAVTDPLARRLWSLHAHAAGLLPHEMAPGFGQNPGGRGITPAAARQVACAFAGVPQALNARTERLGAGYPYPGFLVTIDSDRKPGGQTHVAVAARNGAVLWMSRTGPAGPDRLGVFQAEVAARRFLAKRHIENLRLVSQDTYAGKAAFTYAPERGGVAFADKPIFVKVSLANGQVLAYDGSGYAADGLSFVSLRPAVTPARARTAVCATARVEGVHLVLTRAYGERPKLVYRLLVRTRSDTFRVDVDAGNARVLGVSTISQSL